MKTSRRNPYALVRLHKYISIRLYSYRLQAVICVLMRLRGRHGQTVTALWRDFKAACCFKYIYPILDIFKMQSECALLVLNSYSWTYGLVFKQCRVTAVFSFYRVFTCSQITQNNVSCGFAEVPAEVQSTDSSDRPPSEGPSSPVDLCSLKKEDSEPECPLPVHPEPTRAPVAPTQPYYIPGELLKYGNLLKISFKKKKEIQKSCLLFVCLHPSEPHMAEFPPFYKSTYAWEPMSLRQMSFSPTVLQHTSSLYGTHISHSPPPQQPLDCSTHYSPTSNTYHCITCDKVGAPSHAICR